MSFSTLRKDVLAGLTVGLVLVPQSMAYAQLCGMPPHYGLYAAFVPCIIGALWGNSPFIATGPVAITSLLTVVTLQPYAAAGSARFIEMAILLALMVGIVRLIVGLIRLSFFINFISLPVIRGFTNASAVIIALSQLNKVFGIQVENGRFFLEETLSLFGSIGGAHLPTLLLGAGAFILLLLCKRFSPKLPGALLVVGISGVLVYLLRRYGAAGDGSPAGSIALVGHIPAGIPKFIVPVFGLKRMINLIPGALMVSFIGFMEVNAIGKTLAIRSGTRINLNQEFIGQGLSCIAGSFFQSFPTSASFSRSALSYDSGGKTGLNSVVAGILVLLTVLFLTGLLRFIPQTVLAAVIIVAVFGIFDLKSMIDVWKISIFDGIASLVTFAATLLFAPNLIYGILVGAGLSVLLHLYKTMKPRISVLGKHADGTMRDADLHLLEIDERDIHLRFDGRIYFVSAGHFEDSIMKALERFPKAQRVIIHGEGINEIDSTGVQMLKDTILRLHAKGVTVAILGLKNQVDRILQKAGIVTLAGENNIVDGYI